MSPNDAPDFNGVHESFDALRAQFYATNIEPFLEENRQVIKPEVDVLICPATSLTSVSAEVRYPGEKASVSLPEYYRWLAIAYATTMTTLPIITIPVGVTSSGLPFAVQLVGKPWGEARLFQIAKQIENAVGRECLPVDPN